MLLDLQLYEGKSFYTITGAIIVEEFSEIQSDLTKLSRCFFLGELIDRTVEENQKSEPIFKLFVSGLTLQGQALKNTSRKDEKHELLFWSVCLRIVGRAGFSPSLYECVHCHKKISPEQNYWDNIEGGVICSLCQSKFSHGKKISNETIKILRLMDQGNLTLLAKLNFEQEILTELKIVLDEYISAVLERELKSRRFLQENASTP
jgi:DNA repair protein RecO (recombination protein O)